MTVDLTSRVARYEAGEMSEAEGWVFIADLIRTGLCWRLQGYYGRLAMAAIMQGVISPEGRLRLAVYPKPQLRQEERT